jgi:protein O-GlcNAc transferase
MTTVHEQPKQHAHLLQANWHEILEHIQRVHRDEAWGWSTYVERAHVHLLSNDLGHALLDIEQAFEQIVLEAPDLPTGIRMQRTLAWFWAGVGTALAMRGHLTQALQAFEEAVKMEPSCVPALYGQAMTLSLQGLPAPALKAATATLAHAPEHAGALLLKSQCYLELGQPALAWRIALRLHRLSPGMRGLAGMLLLIARQQAHWGGLGLDGEPPHLPGDRTDNAQSQQSDVNWLMERLAHGHAAVDPATLMILVDDPEAHAMAARVWHVLSAPAARAEQRPPPCEPPTQPQVGRDIEADRTRLVYVVGQWSRSADSQPLLMALRAHDPAKYELVALIWVGRDNDKLQGLRSDVGSDLTVLCANEWSDERIVDWCREHSIEVAVNLQGLDRHGRWGVFVHRAAPIQVNWLGYPGSMPGVGFDYVIADSLVLHPELRASMHESVVHLPHGHIPFHTADWICERQEPPTRDEMGLWGFGPVVCYFGEAEFITPELWACWMRIMLSVPDALLWLRMPELSLQQTLRSHAVKHGVEPMRLVFLRPCSEREMLASASLAYLGLDTFPFNALEHVQRLVRAGVPPVSCAGKSFASRLSASLLVGLGCQDLVADGLDAYERKVVQLLTHPDMLMACRSGIREKSTTECPISPERLVRSLEAAFEQMCLRSRCGQPPSDILFASDSTQV